MRSILRSGLQPGLSRGKLRVVWLHTRSRTEWATSHVAEQHDTDAVAVLTVEVPRRLLRRWSRGVWVSAEVIRPAQIVSIRPPQFA